MPKKSKQQGEASPELVAMAQSANPYFGKSATGRRRAAEIANSLPALRPSRPSNSRSRTETTKSKKGRAVPMAPTAERMSKGDVDFRVGMHRSIPPIERLRDQGKLAPNPIEEVEKAGGLSCNARENQALYEAALKLRRHYDGLGLSVQAQDLNKIVGGASSDDLTAEEAWVAHRDAFRIAVKLMGWSDANPLRGAGRLVVAVVCEETAVSDAARQHIGRGDTTALMGAAMDRLREGLFALAVHWRMI